jgi:hypothetical protein
MDILVTMYSTDFESRAKFLVEDNQQGELAKLWQSVEHILSDLNLWLASHSGRILLASWPFVNFRFPSDKIDELAKLPYALSDDLHLVLGVGLDLSQSNEAAKIAIKNDKRIYFYDPKEDQEESSPEKFESLLKSSPSKTLANQLSELQTKGQEKPLGPKDSKMMVVESLQTIKQLGPKIEQFRQTDPELYEGILGIIHAMIAMLKVQDRATEEDGSESKQSSSIESEAPEDVKDTLFKSDDSGKCSCHAYKWKHNRIGSCIWIRA